MKLFQRSDLESLLAPPPPPCVSILMPTERHYPETDQNPIRYKNLLKRTEKLLGGLAGAPAVDGVMTALQQLGQTDLWRSPREGLAVYAAPGFLRHYRVPLAPSEQVTVSDTFHVRPLLKLLAANRRFLVVAVSLKRAAVYEGTALSLAPIPIDGLPATIEEALGPEQGEPTLNLHVTRGDRGTAVYHGHGAPYDFKKDDAVRFFRHVDEALCGAFHDPEPPVVLAGAATYLPIYREVSRYRNLVEGEAEGNFDHEPVETLHERAWPAASAHLERNIEVVLREYEKGVSLGQSVTDLSQIGLALVQGRIRTLLIADGEHVWGSIDRETGEVTMSAVAQTGEDDLLDDLAEGVLARRGDVLVLGRDRMPGASPVAALMRW